MKTEPLLNSDGKLHEFTLKVNRKRFFCDCGCNVFHKPNKDIDDLFQCNACDQKFTAT